MDSFEVSHGKPRPMLPRPSDTQAIEPRSDSERTDGRRPDGTAIVGNQIALGRGWKSAIRQTLERSNKVIGADPATAADMQAISDRAAILYRGAISSAPVSGIFMRGNAAGWAREFEVASYYDQKADEAGLATDRGQKLAERASFHRQRAERLSITAHVMSQRPKAKTRRKASPWAITTEDK